MDKTQIRHASTVVLLKREEAGASVLMGQRGSKAAFMPDKFVFPGGAVDASDGEVAGQAPTLRNKALLETRADMSPQTLINAAVRELWEETGLVLGVPGETADAPDDWKGFVDKGVVPAGASLDFFFRAVTPPGRPRRFDARFFLADVGSVTGDIEGFSDASDELSHLQWVPLKEARSFPLPFITEIVLAEVGDILARPEASRAVPFFYHDENGPSFIAIDTECT